MGTWLRSVWEDRERRIVAGLCLVLLISVAAVYAQTGGFDFLDYDDPYYVPDNPMVTGGLTWEAVKWAFTTTHGGFWFPLVWLSLMANRELFGAGAGGFHLVNVALHIGNAVLLFWVLRRYTRAIWASFFVAAFFGLHPLHVESVAWVTERKDVLSTLFWLLTMLAYVRYVERPTARRYAVIVGVFALALMAKPMLVTLPFALLVMDYWPLERLWPERSVEGVPLRRLILEKVPLIVMSALLSVATYAAQRDVGAMSGFGVTTLEERVSNVLTSYCEYLLKMVWPARLAVFYPYPVTIAWLKAGASAAVLLVVTAAVVLLRRRRYLAAGWLWYLGTLVPVIGFVQVGGQAFADRYTYMPLAGIFIMLAWAVNDIVGGRRLRGVVACVVGSAVIAALGVITYGQVGYWRDTRTLFAHAAAVTADNFIARIYLGVALMKGDDAEGALREFKGALRFKPRDALTLRNIGGALAVLGRMEEAVEYYNRVLEVAPADAAAYDGLALIEAQKGEFERAMDLYRRGLEHNPEDVRLHGGLGSLLLRTGRVDEAIVELEKGAKAGADSGTYVNLGAAVLAKGDGARAMECYEKAIELNPGNAEAHYNLGNAFLAKGEPYRAMGEYEAAIKARPNYAKAYGNLAVALAQTRQIDEAIKSFRRAAELEPNSPDAYFNLAGALAEKGRFDEAVGQMRKVVELAPQDTAARCELGNLLLEGRRVEEAIVEYEQVLKTDPMNKDAQLGLQKARDAQAGRTATNP